MFSLLILIIYVAFISLGLPDALLGSAWPIMHLEMNVPISYAGIVSMVTSLGTIISSLFSDRLTKRFSTAKVTAFSVMLTAIALLGFSLSSKYYMLIIWAIPYGIGAGGIDASLNNYVALNYSSKHMSWLHCMWGIGASLGPYIMTFALVNTDKWNNGYLYIAILQIVLTVFLFMSIPLWKKTKSEEVKVNKPLKLKEIFAIKGAKAIMLAFFCYCALEVTAGLWASSFLVDKFRINKELAASMASLFYLGITLGRAINGFLTIKFSDKTLIRTGMVGILLGVILLLLPFDVIYTYIGLFIIGLGCAPIYPCIIHSTPELFGEDKSQAVIGVQMASAYIGTLLVPPLFGIIADNITIKLFPMFILVFLILMFYMYENLLLQRDENE